MLRDSGVGWFVGNVYVGALAYADIALLTPTARTMRQLLCICDQYSEKFSIACLMLPCQPGCLLVKVSNSVLVYLRICH